jgi:uncharacterized membrane protein YhaH (DUF805 family)
MSDKQSSSDEQGNRSAFWLWMLRIVWAPFVLTVIGLALFGLGAFGNAIGMDDEHPSFGRLAWMLPTFIVVLLATMAVFFVLALATEAIYGFSPMQLRDRSEDA